MLWFWTNNLESRREKGSYIRLKNNTSVRLCMKPQFWSFQYGLDHFCTTHTHRNTHMHDLNHFPNRKLRPHTAATLPCCQLKWGAYCSVVCGSVSVPRQNTQTLEKKKRNMNATKQFCLVSTLITLPCSWALFYLFVNSVWPLTPRFLSRWRIPGCPFAALCGDRHILCGGLPHCLHGGHCGGVPDEEHNKETRFWGPASCPQTEQADSSAAPGNRK